MVLCSWWFLARPADMFKLFSLGNFAWAASKLSEPNGNLELIPPMLSCFVVLNEVTYLRLYSKLSLLVFYMWRLVGPVSPSGSPLGMPALEEAASMVLLRKWWITVFSYAFYCLARLLRIFCISTFWSRELEEFRQFILWFSRFLAVLAPAPGCALCSALLDLEALDSRIFASFSKVIYLESRSSYERSRRDSLDCPSYLNFIW